MNGSGFFNVLCNLCFANFITFSSTQIITVVNWAIIGFLVFWKNNVKNWRVMQFFLAVFDLNWFFSCYIYQFCYVCLFRWVSFIWFALQIPFSYFRSSVIRFAKALWTLKVYLYLHVCMYMKMHIALTDAKYDKKGKDQNFWYLKVDCKVFPGYTN